MSTAAQCKSIEDLGLTSCCPAELQIHPDVSGRIPMMDTSLQLHDPLAQFLMNLHLPMLMGAKDAGDRERILLEEIRRWRRLLKSPVQVLKEYLQQLSPQRAESVLQLPSRGFLLKKKGGCRAKPLMKIWGEGEGN